MNTSQLSLPLLFLVLFVACVQCAPSALSRSKRSTLSEEAERVVKQGTSVNTNDVGALVDLVERNNANECLARVICELVANSSAHGESGSKFGRALLKFRQSKHPKIEYYLNAMTAGTKTKQVACKNNYKNCPYPSSEIVEVGNRVLKSN